MKKSFSKIVSVLLAVMFAVSAMACMASAKVEGCTCPCCELGSNTCTGKDDGIRDIYLVLDISGSMSGAPVKALKDAAKTFCKMMLDEAAGDNRIAIVTYATTVNSYTFSTDIDEVSATIDGIKAKGSTNMYDALMKVKDLKEKFARNGASQHVVIMADGLPNESATLTEGKYTSRDSSMYYKHGNAVYSVASGMWFDYSIYSIGFFHNLGGKQLEFGKVLMDDIENELYMEVFDPDELVGAFIDVADCIIGCICEEGCTCGDDYGCCECCTAGETTTVPPTDPTNVPCTNIGADGNCNCDVNCICGENCNCGEDCKCDTPPCEDAVIDENGNCSCDENCVCGADCDCGENCTCGEQSIPPMGDSTTGVAVAAVIMLAGIAFVASKKKEN